MGMYESEGAAGNEKQTPSLCAIARMVHKVSERENICNFSIFPPKC